jgi:hypothetical protein
MKAYRAEFDDGLVIENLSEKRLEESIIFYCSRPGFYNTENRKVVKRCQVVWE